MKKLYEEMTERFPELGERMQDHADLPYRLMTDLAEWLAGLPPPELTPELCGRAQAFTRWCEDQPRTENAATDSYTILCVGFYEHLFCTDTARWWLTKLIPREEITHNADYLQTWVGEDDYNKALAQYDANA